MPISPVGRTESPCWVGQALSPARAAVCAGIAQAEARATERAPRLLGQGGVTLMEMLIVVALVGLLAGISYPTASAGLDNIRLASASEEVAAFLNAAVTRAERRQEPVEVEISLAKSQMAAFAADRSVRRFKTPDGISLQAVLPELTGAENEENNDRHFILLPGATVPAIGVELGNRHGGHRIVRLDPMTGFPHVESVVTK